MGAAESAIWKVSDKKDGRWEVRLKNNWEEKLVGGGRWTLNIDGMWDVGPQNT